MLSNQPQERAGLAEPLDVDVCAASGEVSNGRAHKIPMKILVGFIEIPKWKRTHSNADMFLESLIVSHLPGHTRTW